MAIFLFILVAILGFLLGLFLPVPQEKAASTPRFAVEQDPTGPGIVGGAWIQMKKGEWRGSTGPLARGDLLRVTFDLKNVRSRPQVLDFSSLKLLVGPQEIQISESTTQDIYEADQRVSPWGKAIPPQKLIHVEAYFALPRVTAQMRMGFRGFDWRIKDYAQLNLPLKEERAQPRTDTGRR